MNDEKLDELRVLLRQAIAPLSAKLETLDAKLDGEAAKNEAFRTDVRVEFAAINAHIQGIDKRLDDQSRTVNALIPTKVAATGGKNAA